jgi:hypothetical protein
LRGRTLANGPHNCKITAELDVLGMGQRMCGALL